MNAPLTVEHSVCGIHRDTGAVCERCARHRVWLAKFLADQKPFYLVLAEREACRGLGFVYPIEEAS